MGTNTPEDYKSVAPLFAPAGGGPVFPQSREMGCLTFQGMSLRAHFAGLAMQAFIRNYQQSSDPSQRARLAVQQADALIAELNK